MGYKKTMEEVAGTVDIQLFTSESYLDLILYDDEVCGQIMLFECFEFTQLIEFVRNELSYNSHLEHVY